VADGAARAGSQHALEILKENRGALRQVFRQGVKVAAEHGFSGLICQAVDGTKIRAASLRRGVGHRPELEQALGQVEASVREMECAVEAGEAEEEGEYRLPPELQAAQSLRQAIQASLGRSREVQQEHLYPQELDARVMPCEGRKEPTYNAQVAVDAASGLIGAEPVGNEESDNRQLVPMLDEVQENLGQVAAETVADGSYKSAVGLAEAEAKAYPVLVNLGQEAGSKRGGPDHRSRFPYEASQDVVLCPRGERLKFERVKRNRHWSYAVRVAESGALD